MNKRVQELSANGLTHFLIPFLNISNNVFGCTWVFGVLMVCKLSTFGV